MNVKKFTVALLKLVTYTFSKSRQDTEVLFRLEYVQKTVKPIRFMYIRHKC